MACDLCYCSFLFVAFALFLFCFVFVLSLELFVDDVPLIFFLSSRPLTGLSGNHVLVYITGYG